MIINKITCIKLNFHGNKNQNIEKSISTNMVFKMADSLLKVVANGQMDIEARFREYFSWFYVNIEMKRIVIHLWNTCTFLCVRFPEMCKLHL